MPSYSSLPLSLSLSPPPSLPPSLSHSLPPSLSLSPLSSSIDLVKNSSADWKNNNNNEVRKSNIYICTFIVYS